MAQRKSRRGGRRRDAQAGDDGEASPPVSRARSRTRRAVQGVRRARAAARNAAGAAREAAAARRLRVVAGETGAHLCLVRAPSVPMGAPDVSDEITVATYNVHRWTGLNGRSAPDPARAGFVISELGADVIALQEVLRPTTSRVGTPGPFLGVSDDPLVDLAEALGMHLVFAVTREHRRGQLGNAILSRFPLSATSVLDISHSRLERRGALAALFNGQAGDLAVVATHLSLVDRTRRRQVQALLDHPQLNAGPAVLLGDMNAWRRCKATRELDETMKAHHNLDWPASFPSAAPVLALDRIYTRGAALVDVRAHDTPAARRASDHLPIVATISVDSEGR